MLIEKNKNKYEVNDILSFKMINGDEILGRLISVDDQFYELNKPCVVVTSQEGIALISAMFGIDPDLENMFLKEQHIIAMCRTHDRMREHYESVVEGEE